VSGEILGDESTPRNASMRAFELDFRLFIRGGHAVTPTLTRRERDVLRLLVEGYSNREIATRLAIREQTVKDHVSMLLKKFEARSRVALAVAAVRAGF
jgi:DNA-binding NarL/FixJ family response regulator